MRWRTEVVIERTSAADYPEWWASLAEIVDFEAERQLVDEGLTAIGPPTWTCSTVSPSAEEIAENLLVPMLWLLREVETA